MLDLTSMTSSGQGIPFMPHGHCYLWDPLILWLQNGSDALIALSYFAIPAGLFYYIHRRPKTSSRTLIFLFATFIFACGLTHIMDIVTTWYPAYALQGAIKLVTALISAATAIILIPKVPRALTLRSAEELEESNRRLQDEAVQRAKAQDLLHAANLKLERSIEVHVADLLAERHRGESYLEALQKQKDELAASNAELEQFAYAASHDLKAPLRAIDNLSQWIGEDLDEGNSASVKEHLDMMRQRVRRMSALLDSLLEYSRVGRQKHDSTSIDLQALIREVLETLPVPETFTVDIQAGIEPFQGPETPLRQVLLNLVSNALKHSRSPSGHLWIACQDRGQTVEISVRDDGPGIEKRFHERIFKIFQTLRPRDEVEGSGIGLALVKKIVENHGGWIRLESEPGHGSTFTVVWPKEPA